ncbi:hypothetical protein [Bacillus rubiinfantis]|nr:hypothetical protein [Bacillus rubiinfantis]
MGMKLIDIDTLLESTFDLTSENLYYFVKQVEIDMLLDRTKDW